MNKLPKDTHLVEGHGYGSGDGETLAVLELALDGGEVADGEVLRLPRYVNRARGDIGGARCRGHRRLGETPARARGREQQEKQQAARGEDAAVVLMVVKPMVMVVTPTTTVARVVE